MRRHLDILSMFGVIFFFIAALAGCGGGGGATGGGSGASTRTVSGVAAAGAPIIGFVWLKDSTGYQKGPSTIASDGSFSFDVSDMTAPFYLCADGAVGSTSYRFYSATTSAGTANVTPLTSLVVAAAAGVTDPASVYGSTTAATVPVAVNKAALDQAVADLKLMLAPLLTAYGASAIDPIRDPYKADHTGLDAVMDVVKVEIAATTGAVTVTDKTDGTVLTSATTTTMSSAPATYTAPSATVVSDITAIGDMMSGLMTVMSNAARTSSDLDPFFASVANFAQHNGYDRTQAINDWLVHGPDSTITGASGLTILRIDAGVVPPAYYIDGTITLADGSFFAISSIDEGFVVVNEGTSAAPAWKFRGNGNLSSLRFNPQIKKWEKADGSTQVESGLEITIDDQGNKGIATARITGPGLPIGGVTLSTKPSQALRLTLDPAFQNNTMPTSNWEFYVMSDSSISSIPANAVYTIESYNSSSVLMETRTVKLPNPPHTRTDAGAAGFFPALSGIGSHNIADAHIGGTLTINYAKPTTTAYITSSMSAHLNYWDCVNQSANYWKSIPPTGTSVNFISAAPSWVACGGMVDVAADSPDRGRVDHIWMFQ